MIVEGDIGILFFWFFCIGSVDILFGFIDVDVFNDYVNSCVYVNN